MAKHEIMKQIELAFQEFIDTYGVDYVATRSELVNFVHKKYGIKEGSIIPSDYCYNLINDGINLSNPTLFEHVGRGSYRCLGKNYLYNGDVYHNKQMVGICKDGVRKIFGLPEKTVQPPKKKTTGSRDPSTRLRFKVLYRDKFTCRFCGASPTKDTAVTLHVDHIIPWSKGGETSLNNLQTLCAKCNLGKSNLVLETLPE